MFVKIKTERLITGMIVRQRRIDLKDKQRRYFYAKLRVGKTRGYGYILERRIRTAGYRLKTCGSEKINSPDKCNRFFEGRNKVKYVRFKNLQESKNPFFSKELVAETELKKMPEGSRYLSKETVYYNFKNGALNSCQ